MWLFSCFSWYSIWFVFLGKWFVLVDLNVDLFNVSSSLYFFQLHLLAFGFLMFSKLVVSVLNLNWMYSWSEHETSGIICQLFILGA